MAQRSQEEKDRILVFLAENLSFAKTLLAFPGLTVEELKEVLLERACLSPSFETSSGHETVENVSPLLQQPLRSGSNPEGNPPNESLTIFIDGASRGNPGQAGIGVVIRNPEGALLKQISRPLGETTNNVAEYRALLTALDCAMELGTKRLTIYSDSELVVKQINGAYRVKDPNLFLLWSQAKEKLARFELCRLIHISREDNVEANALAQKAAARPAKASLP